MDEVGFPGRPSTRMPPSRPCISGLPGRIAMRQKPSSMPAATSAFLHEVVVADRRPAERHQHVGFERPGPVGLTSSSALHRVGGDAEVDRDAAAGFDNPRHGEIVRGDDLRGAKRSAGSDELVAGRQNGDPGAPADRQIDMIGRSRQRHVAGRETPSGTNESLAFAEIQSRRTQVFARRNGNRDHDAVAVAPHVFLNDDRVGAFGHGRAGEDPHRLARPERRRRRRARRPICRSRPASRGTTAASAARSA